jgi:aminoglycoside phosphotransferase family enzyme/predicted kinase
MTTPAVANGQQDVIAFLSTPRAYGLPDGTPVERIDTHISVVWLAAQRAYKLKRAVRFDYVDFSTAELRRVACEAEVRLNRRTAPALYKGVHPITRSADGVLSIGGHGEPIDWVVEMVRFDQNTLFDRLAERRQLGLSLMDGLADGIAHLHTNADRRKDHGGRAGMAWVIDGNALGFAQLITDEPRRAIAGRMTAAANAHLTRHTDLLEQRRRDGFVRECHGDLHLRNVCLLGGVPTIFDGVEFNDQISCIDVLYDLAFLLMDLWRRQLRAHANAVFNHYLERTSDLGGLALLPLFLSCRAAVRAKTSAAAADVQSEPSRIAELQAAVGDYIALSEGLLKAVPPLLVAIGGLSGSGKSTLARALGPMIGAAPGAVILRSDVTRKREFGVDPLQHLGGDAYTSPVNERVYRIIADRAKTALSAGQAVIADAVYGNAAGRRDLAAIAHELGVPFVGIWLEVPMPLLAKRLADRPPDASDATAEVLDLQLHTAETPADWYRVDASGDIDTVQRHIHTIIDAIARA